MPLFHLFTDAQRTPPRIGVSKSNPPVTGGTVIDSFMHDDVPLGELHKIAAQRNSPLRVEWRDGVRWRAHGVEFGITPMDLESARQVAIALATKTGTARIVTNRSKIVWEWTPARRY